MICDLINRVGYRYHSNNYNSASDIAEHTPPPHPPHHTPTPQLQMEQNALIWKTNPFPFVGNLMALKFPSEVAGKNAI